MEEAQTSRPLLFRKCGDCTACCKALPVRELGKPGNTRCQYQRHGKGCMVHRTPEMPPSCRLWNCRWLLNDDTGDLRRPDRSGYVIDVMPDFITAQNDGRDDVRVPVVQVWVDQLRPHAWRDDPAFFAYCKRRGEDGYAVLVRNGEERAITILPPQLTDTGQWAIIESGISEKTHTPQDIVDAGFSMQMTVEER